MFGAQLPPHGRLQGSSCSLPEPSECFVSHSAFPALLCPHILCSPVRHTETLTVPYLCASDHAVPLAPFFAQLTPTFPQRQNARTALAN